MSFFSLCFVLLLLIEIEGWVRVITDIADELCSILLLSKPISSVLWLNLVYFVRINIYLLFFFPICLM